MRLILSALISLFLCTISSFAASNSRLENAASPYLRLHEPDAVQWYVWEDATFALAKKLNLPLMVSFGYTACHWCHVMQETHFNVDDIANAINENFIPVIVDRERRPELDEAYMLVTEALTQRGGWPNTVFMTPDRKPFYGTGYVAPDDFRQIIGSILNGWESQQEELVTEADRLSGILQTFMTRKAEASELSPELMAAASKKLVAQFDAFSGGMGDSTKFFQQSILMFLLHQAEQNNDEAALAAVELTLKSIISGGIHDHLEGGVHRYSVDPGWRIPHFEKMLYDQAMMAEAYTEAYRIIGKSEYGRMVRKILDYVLADLTAPNGGFYATRDADSEGEEGTYYVWSDEQLIAALGKEEATFAIQTFQILPEGELAGKIILNRDNIGDQPNPRIEKIFKTLAKARQSRIKPRRDEKIIVNWNGLMISAFARAGLILGDVKYTNAATKAGDFLWRNLRNENGTLMRVYFEGAAAVKAELSDYAFLTRAFLQLYDTTNAQIWLNRATELYQVMEERFADEATGDFFSSSAVNGFGRLKSRQDSDFASANGAALAAIADLAKRTVGPELKRRTEKLIAALSGFASESPSGGASILHAADKFLRHETSPVQYGGGGTVRAHAIKLANDITVQLEVAEGWHVNANKPLEDYLIPTKLTLSEDGSVSATYPKPTIKKLGFSQKPLALLEGKFEIKLGSKTNMTKPSNIQLEIQACSDEICLPPETLKFRVTSPFPAS